MMQATVEDKIGLCKFTRSVAGYVCAIISVSCLVTLFVPAIGSSFKIGFLHWTIQSQIILIGIDTMFTTLIWHLTSKLDDGRK